MSWVKGISPGGYVHWFPKESVFDIRSVSCENELAKGNHYKLRMNHSNSYWYFKSIEEVAKLPKLKGGLGGGEDA